MCICMHACKKKKKKKVTCAPQRSCSPCKNYPSGTKFVRTVFQMLKLDIIGRKEMKRRSPLQSAHSNRNAKNQVSCDPDLIKSCSQSKKNVSRNPDAHISYAANQRKECHVTLRFISHVYAASQRKGCHVTQRLISHTQPIKEKGVT